MTKDDSQDKPVTQIPDDELQYGSVRWTQETGQVAK